MNKFIDKTLDTGIVRIQITNQHIYAKGTWVMHVRELGWNTKPIGVPDSATQEEAEAEAVNRVKAHLLKMYDSLNA